MAYYQNRPPPPPYDAPVHRGQVTQQHSRPSSTNTALNPTYHGMIARDRSSAYQSGTYGRVSTIGVRNQARPSLPHHSRSLGASQASIASQRSGKSSIQQEYHDKQVQSSILSPYYGKGKTPFLIAVGLFIFACLFVIAGGVVFGLRFHNNIMLTIDKGEIVGPVLIAVGILCIGGAIKFYYDAYQISNLERRKLRFSAANSSMITVNTITSRQMVQPSEPTVSGSATTNAVSRTPHSGNATISNV